MPHTPVRLGDATNFVDIDLLERAPTNAPHAGDLRLGVAVRCGTFSGSYDQVWIARDQWSAFLGTLTRLERDRTGRASLHSMSPGEFDLHLEIIDRAGHLAAHGRLSRYAFSHPSGKATRSTLEYAINLDPSTLRGIVEQLRP